MTRVLFFSAGTTGSGHIVRGLAVAAAFKRLGIQHEYAILSSDIPYARLATRLEVSVSVFPDEGEEALRRGRYLDSSLFKAITAYAPDILIVEQFWHGLDAFIRELPCRKVLLTFQMDPVVFHLRIRENEYVLRPADYDLILRTEPGYGVPFAAREINPMVLRNRGEILDLRAARADMGLADGERACLFACSGEEAQVADAWKSFSYLEGEGWKVIRSLHREGGLFPTIDWFNAFDLLVCGAGYNAFWEARWMRKEAYFVPFPRRFENQARRIAQFSDYEFDTNGADELVGMLQGL